MSLFLLFLLLNCLLVLIVVPTTHALGPIFEPLRGGFGRSAFTMLRARLVGNQEEEPELNASSSLMEDHNPTPPVADYWNDVDTIGSTTSAASTGWMGELFYPKPLLWTPRLEEYMDEEEEEEDVEEEDIVFDDVHDDDDNEFTECSIGDEFKVDPVIAADVMDYLGIKRVQPIQIPNSSSLSSSPQPQPEPILVGEWE